MLLYMVAKYSIEKEGKREREKTEKQGGGTEANKIPLMLRHMILVFAIFISKALENNRN